MALDLIVPSRERPRSIARLMDAMQATCRGDTRLIVGVDDDDPTLGEYQSLGCELVVRPCELVVRPRTTLVKWLNHLATGDGFIGHIGDDNVPHTEGWDVRIMESLDRQGEIGFCFGDDLDPGRPKGSLSIHIFMTSEVVRRLGYFGPPRIQHMYVDPVWFAWGTRTSIEFLPDVVLEHLHFSQGLHDDSYARTTALIPTDCANYNAYCEEGMNEDILKLGGKPFSPEEMAEFNRSLNIPKEWGR